MIKNGDRVSEKASEDGGGDKRPKWQKLVYIRSASAKEEEEEEHGDDDDDVFGEGGEEVVTAVAVFSHRVCS